MTIFLIRFYIHIERWYYDFKVFFINIIISIIVIISREQKTYMFHKTNFLTFSFRAFSYFSLSLCPFSELLAAKKTYLKSFWLIGSFQKANHVTVLSCLTSFQLQNTLPIMNLYMLEAPSQILLYNNINNFNSRIPFSRYRTHWDWILFSNVYCNITWSDASLQSSHLKQLNREP